MEARPLVAGANDGTEQQPTFLSIMMSWFKGSSPDNWLADLVPGKINRVDAFVLLLNTMIGAGVLQQAMVFEYSGVITATFLFVIVGYFTYLGANMIAKLADVSGCPNYGDIAYNALGFRGALTVDISIVIFNFTTVILYIIYMGSLTRDVVESYYPDASEWYTTKSFFSAVFTMVIVFPICMVRTYSRLTVVAYFSVLMMIFVALVLCIDGPIEYASEGVGDVLWFSVSGSAMALGNLIYSLGFAPAVVFTYVVLEGKYRKDMHKIVLAAVLAGTVLCFAIGLSGYLLFRDNTMSNILDNLSGSTARICDVGMVAHFALFLPGDFFVLRGSLYHLTQACFTSGGGYRQRVVVSEPPADSSAVTEPSDQAETKETENVPLVMRRGIRTDYLDDVQLLDDLSYGLYTGITLAIITICACLVDVYLGSESTAFTSAINFVGGISGSVDTFVMPGLCGLVYFLHDSELYHKSVALLCFGGICIAFITIGSVLMF